MIEGNYYDVHDPTTVPIWSGTSGFSNDFKYSEQLTYDQRGNIKTLLRNGLAYGSMTNTGQASGTFGPIDNLTYSYDPNNPNRITGITDATGSAAGFGFRNSNAYGYDDNGNLIRDDNKQITKIIYNYLNLPTEIQFWNGYAIIKFTYDAAGNKLMKSTFVNGVNASNAGNPANRYYVGGVEYTGSTVNGTGAVIDMIPNAEGFTRHETDGSYSDNFVLRDHLGNTRVVFSDKNNDGYININTELVQVNAYYPFGLNHGANSNGAGAPYKYQYNGKELNDDLGLNWNDYGRRFYDPAIGRFTSQDALSYVFYRWNPYVYCLDNPVKYIDYKGLVPVGPGDLFTSIEDAARNWAQTYNGASIAENREYGSTIYYVLQDGITYYTYSEPAKGTIDKVAPSEPPFEWEFAAVAIIHSHGNYIKRYINNDFSDQDISLFDRRFLRGFVSTPDGSLKEYYLFSVITLSTSIPSDNHDPMSCSFEPSPPPVPSPTPVPSPAPAPSPSPSPSPRPPVTPVTPLPVITPKPVTPDPPRA